MKLESELEWYLTSNKKRLNLKCWDLVKLSNGKEMNANIRENNLKQLGQPSPIRPQEKKKKKKKYKDPTRDPIVRPDNCINYASIPDP